MENKEIKGLKDEFIGIGEVRGFCFKKINENDYAFIYEVTPPETKSHYEVFEKKIVECFDFVTNEKTGERKYGYPKQNAFGFWAWSCTDLEEAISKCVELTVSGIAKEKELNIENK